MERWFEFMSNHPFLFGLLAVLIVLFFAIENKRSGVKVSPNTLSNMVNQNNAQVIDVRDSKDFNQGHISGSRNIPMSQLSNHLQELQQSERPLIVVCKMGTVAGSVVQKLEKKDAFRLDGGILNWQAAGLPLVKTKAAKRV